MKRLNGIWVCLALLWVAMAAQARTMHFYYTDPQGTVLAKTDAQGNILARYDYKPYGGVVSGQGPNGPGYTGHENDTETGLVYMQARYYDPVGRFLSPDPVGPSSGALFAFNRYAYVNDNPTINTDLTGKAPGDADDFKDSAYPVELTMFGSGGEGGGSAPAQLPTQRATSSPAPSGVKQFLIGISKPVINLLNDIAAVMGDSDAQRAAPLKPSNPSQAVGMMVSGVVVNAASAVATDGESVEANSSDFVDLASPARRIHILTGDASGGGHLFPGLPGKTPFPEGWSADRIMHDISDVATDPNAFRTPGRGGATIVRGTRDGVEIQVIVRKGQIVTGYPVNLPRNP